MNQQSANQSGNRPDTQPDDRPVVAITGCSGLIGTRLAEQLSPRYRLIGLDIQRPDFEVEGFEFIECDLTDDQNVAASVEK